MQPNQTKPNLIPTRKLAFGLLVCLITVLVTAPSIQAQNGTWTNLVSGDASGSWATAANWTNSVIADGADNTADFSTLDITTTNSIVTLDGARMIGNIIFGDTTPDTNWVLNTGTGGPLTLAVTAGTPTITANNGSNTIGAMLDGTKGFNKAGAGTIRLNGANTTLAGDIHINTGILQVGNSGALGVTSANNSASPSNLVVIASGATLQIIGAIAPALKPVIVSGAGAGGTQGAIFADLSGLANGNTATRLTIGLLTFTNPAVKMVGDTTIRVDGTNNSATTSAMLIGHITSTNAVTGTNPNYTLTKTGTGRLQIDPAGGYSGGDIHIVGGSLAFGNNNDLLGSQTVTVDAGAGLFLRNITSLNSINSSLVLNGLLDINARGAADVTVGTQTIGYLSGSGVVTNDNNAAQTLVIAGTNGTSTTFSGTIVKTTPTLASIGLRIQNPNGTLRLTGNNTYVGATAVNAGTLLVNGSHTGGSGYTVNPGATLGGRGSISAPITLSGTLLAGDGGGTLTVSNLTGAGDVIVSNANLTVLIQFNNSGSGNLNSLYLSNSVTTINLQGGSEAAIYATTVNVDGTTNTLNVLMANPALGQFPLIGGISSIGGLNGFSGLKLQLPTSVVASLSNNVANSSIDIVVTSVPQIVWRGTPDGNWTIGGSFDWFNGTPVAYTETAGLGPFVVFDDTATGTTSVNLTNTVSPRGVTVSASSKSYTLSGTGGVSGTGNWVKEGSSTFTVANSGTNNFTGNVTINGGAVQLGNGGAAGDLGGAPVFNSGSLIFDRSDNVTFADTITGSGALTNNGAGVVTLTGIGDVAGAVTVNAGTLALAPAISNTVSGQITGSGAFGASGSGTVVLTSGTITYGGGTVISNATLQFNSVFPPSGNISDNGTLALAVSGTLANNISGSGGVSAINSAAVTLTGANTYSGPTVVLGGSVDATASSYPSGSVLRLGSQTGTTVIGTANFTAGNPVIGGLSAGGNNGIPNAVNLTAGGQTLSINGNVSVGNISPALATVILQPTGTGVSVVVNTNGGTIQIGLGAAGSGVNPDNVEVDFSQINNFICNLGTSTNGTNSVFNMGTLDGNPGPNVGGTTAVNLFLLAAVSNSITAGTINIGAGGRALTPDLRLGPGTNILNVGTLNVGSVGRDGGQMEFNTGSGGVRIRGAAGGSTSANYNQGVNATTTGAGSMTTVDFTGGTADLLFGSMVIGNQPGRVGFWTNVFTFSQGVLNATSVSLSQGGNTNVDYTIMNINGGTATLGPVLLNGSIAANGTLNINGGTVTVQSISYTNTGTSTLSINNATLNVNIQSFGNPATAPVSAGVFTANGTVNLGFSGSGFTVGEFPLISYTGSIGGSGFSALNLTSLPSGVTAVLSNDVANLSVDVVITAAPLLVNTNSTDITATVSGSTLTLSWLADHTGWHLQAQTNSLSTGLGTNWVTIPNTDLSNSYTNTIDPAKGTVFYRMVYP